MDLIATGKSASGRSRIRDLAEEIRRYILEKGASTLKGFTIHKDISERLDLVSFIMQKVNWCVADLVNIV